MALAKAQAKNPPAKMWEKLLISNWGPLDNLQLEML